MERISKGIPRENFRWISDWKNPWGIYEGILGKFSERIPGKFFFN